MKNVIFYLFGFKSELLLLFFFLDKKFVMDYCLYYSLSLPAFPFAAYLVEKLAYQNYLPQLVSAKMLIILHLAINRVGLL